MESKERAGGGGSLSRGISLLRRDGLGDVVNTVVAPGE